VRITHLGEPLSDLGSQISLPIREFIPTDSLSRFLYRKIRLFSPRSPKHKLCNHKQSVKIYP
jgi:hypothetical protein